MKLRYLAQHGLILAALAAGLSAVGVTQDVQVNSADHNSPTLGNETTESETNVTRTSSLAVIGYNTSRQAGLLGLGGWNSLSGYAYSTDGGHTFTDAGFVPAGTHVLEGDPALAFDSSGHIYYASLLEETTGASYIGVSQSTSTSPSVVFGNPVLISGQFSTTGGFQDKEFIAVDNTSGGAFSHPGRVYVAWSEFPSSGNPQLMLAASSSASPLAFSPSLLVAPSTASFQHGAFPIVGPDGALYVAWSTLSSISTAASATINLRKSTDGGATFPNPVVTVANFTSTVGDVGTGGSLRTRSFPYLAVDNTPAGSPTHGNLYAVFQGRPGATATPRSEIFFASSTDGGVTWSPARNISSGPAVTIGSDSTNNDNWMPSISVSPATGHIKVLFYSRREDPGNNKVRVYEAGSTDGGMTWYNRPFSDVSFTPSVGYDPLLVSNYMGDYLNAFADSNGLLGAWGDTRNLCSPPGGATAPCSPTGRGDQDAWSRQENDVTGVDLAITPWGYVTGVGPLWQTPDIFVVNSSSVHVNAEKGIVNLLRAHISNLGNAGATGAVVRFRFAPIYGGVPDSAFKLIGTVTVNVPAGSAQDVPINWDMTNLSDTNGGVWPAPISTFDHFCVKVDIEFASDINLTNNSAQNNFFDVSTGTAPLKPIKFIIGNPFRRNVNVRIVPVQLPLAIRPLIKQPLITMPKIAKLATAPTAKAATPTAGAIALKENEIQVGTITLVRPPASVTKTLTHDIVQDVNMVVDGKIVGGFSFLLAKANAPAPPPKPGPNPASRRVGEAVQAQESPQQKFEKTAAMAPAEAHQAIVRYLTTQNIKVVQNDQQHGLVSSSAIPLTRPALLAAVSTSAQKLVPPNGTGKYFVTFKTTGEGPTARVSVSVRILLITSQDLDSPLGGRLMPSNGTLEQKHLTALAPRLKLQ